MTVSDATPLIALARIKCFPLLKELFSPLMIPSAVYGDVVTRGAGRPGDDELRAAIADGWTRRRDPSRLIDPPYGEMRAGEIEALSLAVELQCDLLVDEGPGRRRARSEGLYFRGTLDVLLLAKLSGHLPAIKPSLDALRAANFYLTDELYAHVLSQASE